MTAPKPSSRLPATEVEVAKVLQICNTDFYLSRFLTPLVLALRERGHEVECLCEGRDLPPELHAAGIPVHSFSFPRQQSLSLFWERIRALTPILRRGRYDCVNSHNRNSSIVARVAAWRAGVPVNLYTAHGLYCNDAQGRLGYGASAAIERFLLPFTTFVLSQSEEDVFLMRRLFGTHDAQVAFIGNGADLETFRPRPDRPAIERRLGLRSGRFRLVAVGRLVHGKGFHDLLEAFAGLDHPDVELVQVGGNIPQDVSPFSQQYRKRVRELGLEDRVVMTGMTDDVASYLAASDVFVLPSYWEGLPRSLLEAMAIELPVVATRIRGCREMITPGVEGLLVPPRDPARLARALDTMVRMDPEQRRRFGEAGRKKVDPFFGLAAYTDRQIDHIERLVELHAPGRGRPSPTPFGSSHRMNGTEAPHEVRAQRP